MTDDPTIALLERALDQATVVIDAIRPDQATLPTPCSEWNVQALVQHLVGQDTRNYIRAARGEMPDWQVPPDELGPDWSADFGARVAELRRAWHDADLDRLVPWMGGHPAPLRQRADQQLTEFTVHSWDLAVATGQDLGGLDPELAEHALRWAQPLLRPEVRGAAFAPSVPVGDDAPAYDRLAGWFGRDPAWRPPAG